MWMLFRLTIEVRNASSRSTGKSGNVTVISRVDANVDQ
jgi:hypothetical protein